MKTNQEKENKDEESSLKKENQTLRGNLNLLQDQMNLQNDSFWRQQVLIQLERIANALETFLEGSKKKNK